MLAQNGKDRQKVVIVDYGMGNLGSIVNMFKKIGIDAAISSDISVVEKAERLVLPGVGAFDSGMKNLEDRGLLPVLDEKVFRENTPVLGICLGMQLMTRGSAEGALKGLGWFDADTVRFKFEGELNELKIPHMGWNNITVRKNHAIFDGIGSAPRFYFVHSYHVLCDKEEDVLAVASHGYEFASVIGRRNIMGVQFHPEKSHRFGMKLLKNFVERI